MNRRTMALAALAVLAMTACGRTQSGNDGTVPPAQPAAPTTTTASPDAEFEQLKTIAAPDACTWLTADKLAPVYPGLAFEVHQKVEPRMSGYAWDSRCTYWTGVGSIEFAKDAPTHTVEIFVITPVSEAKAKANLAARHETAAGASGYRAQPELGADAYAVTNTGMASLYFVKGASEVQLNASDLNTPNDEKIRKLLAIARSL